MEATSLYLHIPFCRKRCPYCDFNTYAGMERWVEPYLEAMLREIRCVAQMAGPKIPVHTIFFGGGTPSLLTAGQLERVLTTLESQFELLPGAEISLEANPGTVDLEYLQALRGLGFNRLSLGVQSFQAAELKFLGRIHDSLEVFAAVQAARRAGFDNLNLDLIFGLPEQELNAWKQTLETALSLEPEHLSLYSLIVEEGTPLQRWVERGLVSSPDDDLAADEYDFAEERLAKAGYVHYEISNWARAGTSGEPQVCRHNLQYWRCLPYLGFGAGAHGYAGGVRTANVKPVRAYIQKCEAGAGQKFPLGPALDEYWEVDEHTARQERMMVGLRLLEEGVAAAEFEHRFGLPLEKVFGDQLKRLAGEGLLEWCQGAVRLTQRGHLLGNRVFREFV